MDDAHAKLPWWQLALWAVLVVGVIALVFFRPPGAVLIYAVVISVAVYLMSFIFPAQLTPPSHFTFDPRQQGYDCASVDSAARLACEGTPRTGLTRPAHAQVAPPPASTELERLISCFTKHRVPPGPLPDFQGRWTYLAPASAAGAFFIRPPHRKLVLAPSHIPLVPFGN